MQGLTVSASDTDRNLLFEGAVSTIEYEPGEDWEWWAGLGSAVLAGTIAGAAVGGVGAPVGAAIGLLAFLLAWLLTKIFGGDKDRQKEHTEADIWLGDQRVTETSYQQSATQDIGPPGVVSQDGGATAGRSYALRNIPHFTDDNLYGLAFSGADTFRIVEDAAHRETLAWRAFEGGVGYQFDRMAPGRAGTAAVEGGQGAGGVLRRGGLRTARVGLTGWAGRSPPRIRAARRSARRPWRRRAPRFPAWFRGSSWRAG
ncbi:hypothetical protein [Streptomyces litchfieldiae]|uniref:Uncharacterized protein n=1 Tax=Streptomyces litchfieldiae TaxID=3075543 RepID=A0ABU2MIX0_9ACTN|nr:hypothetical protein [Streptomyces sp. DSM 44938]MDT0341524.1 hypothetical protein [Streptomyces sp. DSM 44938]